MLDTIRALLRAEFLEAPLLKCLHQSTSVIIAIKNRDVDLVNLKSQRIVKDNFQESFAQSKAACVHLKCAYLKPTTWTELWRELTIRLRTDILDLEI